ncbi:hypothetical protein [Lichenibacterium dinghuense]|uniref:hypothetical protein n=1 Tax=Lichenibacterium dinghuense TaxID=2895977 RepID=UPI001F1BE3A7|nr:hypothetical protein [Lichenibacterium sp. 6Y81]
MTTDVTAHHRPFLDVTEAETAVDLGMLKDVLTEAALNAEKLGLHAVKEHLAAALAHVAEQADGDAEA